MSSKVVRLEEYREERMCALTAIEIASNIPAAKEEVLEMLDKFMTNHGVKRLKFKYFLVVKQKAGLPLVIMPHKGRRFYNDAS